MAIAPITRADGILGEYENNPIYKQGQAALLKESCDQAASLTTELLEVERFKPYALHTLAIIENKRRNYREAERLAFQAYELGNRMALGEHLLSLVYQKKYNNLESYHDYIFDNARENKATLEVFSLLTEFFDNKDSGSAFIRIIRRTPLEMMLDIPSVIRCLMKYGKPQDAVLLSFLYSSMSASMRSEIQGAYSIMPLPRLPPSKELMQEILINPISKKSWELSESEHSYRDALSNLLPLMENKKYNPVLLPYLGDLYYSVGDIKRAEQLYELACKIGDISRYDRFLVVLLYQGKLNKIATYYEQEFYDVAISDRLTPRFLEAFVHYCLENNAKDLFLKWVRKCNPSKMLIDKGTKEETLRGLERWGGQEDAFTIAFLKAGKVRSQNQINWEVSYGPNILNIKSLPDETVEGQAEGAAKRG
jgi:tetratricopeptide (TPR) repeat protein